MSDYHPNYRALWLSHIRQVRMMLKEGRQTLDCRAVLKLAQREAVKWRKARILMN